MDWIREAIAQEEAAREKESAAQIAAAPGSENAKQGLYEGFKKCLQDSSEIMITHQKTLEKSDILITGILDEPVNFKILVGAGMAELFVPKLREFFKRKSLVSFAVKQDITRQHFYSFVDIMSDPKAYTGEGADESQRNLIDSITDFLGSQGIQVLSKILSDSVDRSARKNAMDALTKKGDLVRDWKIPNKNDFSSEMP